MSAPYQHVGYSQTTGKASDFVEEGLRYGYTLSELIAMVEQAWVIVQEEKLRFAKKDIEYRHRPKIM